MKLIFLHSFPIQTKNCIVKHLANLIWLYVVWIRFKHIFCFLIIYLYTMCISKKCMIESATHIKSLIENLLVYSFSVPWKEKLLFSKLFLPGREKIYKAADSIINFFLGTLYIKNNYRWREWCGLKPFKSWHDLHGVMFNTSIAWYPRLYESPEVHLYSSITLCLPLVLSSILDSMSPQRYTYTLV